MTAPGAENAASLAEMLDERQHLLDTALAMVGSATTADRIVRETYRRWYALSHEQRAGIAVPRAWLSQVTEDICLETLASGSTTETASIGVDGSTELPWLRQFPITGPTVPLGEDCSGRPALARHERVTARFAAACDRADPAVLRATLAADAIVVSDGGGKVRAAIHPTRGRDAVARFITSLFAGLPRTAVTVEPVNARAGLVVRRAGQAVAVASLSVAGTEVTAVWIVLNPDKLRRWHRP
jgi:RNA polymerase sigma-70 factor (ECF subfamily)